jgi:hypothetical protein
MADEVVIRLQAQSAQLEASINRLEKSLQRLDTRAKKANTAMQTGAQRTSKSINNQNKSFTLMVAKLALVTFAAQTLANIFQNTFGAILKTIDDFQVAAIGAAAAVTSITSSGEPIGEVFDQNLEAALQTFEALELVAAQFFSTGQELQLAFNTLAQRGVVIREEEFEILGKLTDQIKLLTGGQNSQIQIQQELRAILDGNVRTTTAFGKSLQSRGVDIQQLSREVRATGSIKVFEQFLTGLDAAGGSIRRTLTSVLTTFKSLFAILTRNIFQDTYDDIVAQITQVNNFIIEQREELIAVGQVIVTKVKAGLDLVLGVAKEILDLFSDLGTSKIGQLLIFFKAIASIGSTPLRVLLIIGAVVGSLTGDFRSVADSIDIFVKSLRIGLKVLENGLGLFTDFTGTLRNLEQGLRGLQNVSLVSQEAALEEQIAGLSPEQRESSRGQRLQDELARVRKNINDNVAAIEQNIAEAGKDAGTDFTTGLGESVAAGLKSLNLELDEKMDELGIVDTEDRIKQAFEDLLKQSQALEQKPKVDFADTNRPFSFDTAALKAGLKQAEQLELATQNNITKTRRQATELERERIQRELAERKITGLEAFRAEQALGVARKKADIEVLESRLAAIKATAESERQIVAIDASPENAERIPVAEEQARLAKIQTTESTKRLRVEQQIETLKADLAKTAVEDAKKVTEETEKVNRLLRQRRLENEQLFATTSGDRAASIQETSRLARENFATENLGDEQAIAEFNRQQTQRDFAQVAAPQIEAFKSAIDGVFNELINGIVEGAFEFRDLAQTISKDLIKSGMEDLIANTKKIVIGGIEDMFEGIGIAASGRAAQALALGIGLMLAVLSRIGSEGEFTASGAGAGGSGLQSSAQTRGLIGGSTAIPIAEINNGLQEALIPTNSILTQIERNTRVNAAANLDLDPAALQDALNNSLNQIFQQAVLQNGP